MKIIRKFLIALSCLSATYPAISHAKWPEKPITIVVPYSPGGTSDTVARIIAQHLGEELHTPVVIQNKSGASGTIGERTVIQSKPDGYTFLYDATPLSINPFVQKLNFDPYTDLKPVTLVGTTPMLFITGKNSPFNTFKDFIDATKKSPGHYTFGSGGISTVQFMGAYLLNQKLGLDLLHVPYKSGGPSILAVLSNEIDVVFGNLPAVKGQIEAGLAKPLAISSEKRNPLFPDVPTVAESGIENYSVYEWNGIFAPRNTPDEIINQLQDGVQKVLNKPEVKKRIEELGSSVVASSSTEFSQFLQKEAEKWKTTLANTKDLPK